MMYVPATDYYSDYCFTIISFTDDNTVMTHFDRMIQVYTGYVILPCEFSIHIVVQFRGIYYKCITMNFVIRDGILICCSQQYLYLQCTAANYDVFMPHAPCGINSIYYVPIPLYNAHPVLCSKRCSSNLHNRIFIIIVNASKI